MSRTLALAGRPQTLNFSSVKTLSTLIRSSRASGSKFPEPGGAGFIPKLALLPSRLILAFLGGLSKLELIFIPSCWSHRRISEFESRCPKPKPPKPSSSSLLGSRKTGSAIRGLGPGLGPNRPERPGFFGRGGRGSPTQDFKAPETGSSMRGLMPDSEMVKPKSEASNGGGLIG